MSNDTKKPTPGYSPACINQEAVYWLNASPESRERIILAGGSPPSNISGDDHFAAAQQRNKEIASPALGNNAKRARDLLSLGADISHDFNAAVQNAAAGGHEDVLKLALVADEDFQAAQQDAYRAAGRRSQSDVITLLLGARSDDATEKMRKDMRKEFVYAVTTGRPKEAAVVLDKMVALMFPKSPKIG